MPFQRPAITDLISAASNDINSRLPGADSRLRRSTVGVLSRVSGAGLNGLYEYLDYIADQILPDTAAMDWLVRHCAIWGITPADAAPATGPVSGASPVADGTPIPAETVLVRGDGVEYRTTADAAFAGGAITLTVETNAPGSASNADAGVILTLATPIDGVTSAMTVMAPGLQGGLDAETQAQLLARLLERIQNPPQGGAQADYVTWALQCSGVTRAWCYPGWNGVGSVGVAFMMDARPDPIPTDDDVATVQAYIDGVRPVTAEVVVFAPTPDALNFTISVQPATAAVKAAVEAELTDFVTREAVPGGTLPWSRQHEAISEAAGEYSHILTVPAGDVVSAPGHIAVMGVITWAD